MPVGACYLDCRKLGGEQFEIFKNCISQACESIRNMRKHVCNIVPQEQMYCCMVYWILSQSIDLNVVAFRKLWEIVSDSKDSYYVPESKNGLFKTLQYLEEIGVISIIICSECFWIIVDKGIILKNVNGVIFAPDNFGKIKKDLASDTGIYYTRKNISLSMCSL